MSKSLKLEEFRKQKKLSHKKLAALLGQDIDHTTVFRWCNGERIPRKAMMTLITEKTNGKVKASSFYE
tara:strand:+ start:313 stop:516 length:204 start_codon:yes stop_codon:yes gene_type:complete